MTGIEAVFDSSQVPTWTVTSGTTVTCWNEPPYIEWVLYVGFAHGFIGLALFALSLGAFIVD